MRTAALTPGAELWREADPPSVLSANDAFHYRRIFTLQDSGRWIEANRDIAQLEDKLLLGPVLAQRYLSRGFHATYPELRDWLERYADEPDAKAIYSLAFERRPRGAAPLPRPVAPGIMPPPVGDGDSEPRVDAQSERVPNLTLAERRRAEALRQEIRRALHEAPRRAELLLAGPEAKQLLAPSARDELRLAIAGAYLSAGDAEAALVLSAEVGEGSFTPLAHWRAGLSAWRLGRLEDARRHFQALAHSPNQSPWTVSAAAFWAARVELRARRPELVSYWLQIAAQQPRTFYGILAHRLLGIDSALSFEADPLTLFDVKVIAGADGGKRALALIEIGERVRAEEELQRLAGNGSPPLVRALAALAERANMPALTLRLAGAMASLDGRNHVRALYPVPQWAPRNGFRVDRALLFAFMRQESEFHPGVESSAGALGLMQIMPQTARSMAARTGVALHERGKNPRQTLTDPEVNLMLAQEYVSVLVNDPQIKGNLLLIISSYNAGPAAALRWLAQRPELKEDPLFFLESIPARQSRVFTHRVLASYWMYRQHLNQPTPDLDALAAGEWPTYIALDSVTADGRQHAANR